MGDKLQHAVQLEEPSDYVSDVLVQLDQEIFERPSAEWPRFVKSYMDREYGLEMHIRVAFGGVNADYIAVVECARGRFDFRLPAFVREYLGIEDADEGDDWYGVLIKLREVFDDLQWVSCGFIRSRVRLKCVVVDELARPDAEIARWFAVAFNAEALDNVTRLTLGDHIVRFSATEALVGPDLRCALLNLFPCSLKTQRGSFQVIEHECSFKVQTA